MLVKLKNEKYRAIMEQFSSLTKEPNIDDTANITSQSREVFRTSCSICSSKIGHYKDNTKVRAPKVGHMENHLTPLFCQCLYHNTTAKKTKLPN